MKKLLTYLSFSFLLVLSFTACEEDPLGGGTGGGTGGSGGGSGGTANGPSLLLITETGFVSDVATINQGTEFFVKLQGEKGDADLQAITIYEDGVAISSTRITDGGNSVVANPFLITGLDVTSFVKEIGVISIDFEDTKTYEFELKDVDGNTDSGTVSITTAPEQVTPPTITIGGSGMFMTAPSSIFTVPVTVSDVTSPLLVVGVFQDGVEVSPDRLWWETLSNPNWGENPGAIDDADKLGFSRNILIRAHDSGIATYAIAVADGTGETYFQEFTVEVESATPVTTLEGILFNRAGPTGTGGLDLDTGASTGSADPEAEIKDEGIDLGLPTTSNWIRKISAANDAMIKQLIPNQGGLIESFTFDGVTSVEQIASVWDNGITFVEVNTDGQLRSERVEVGQMYVVERQGKFYIIQVKEVNETMDNNNDNYVVDIKF